MRVSLHGGSYPFSTLESFKRESPKDEFGYVLPPYVLGRLLPTIKWTHPGSLVFGGSTFPGDMKEPH